MQSQRPALSSNRVARPFYGEALRLCEEQVADPATIDALIEGSSPGSAWAPFELMDLIGHDVNHAVNMSVFGAYYQDPRFRPSNLQLELINAGRLGRKERTAVSTSMESRLCVRCPFRLQAGPDGRPLEGFSCPDLHARSTVSGSGNTDGRTAHRLSAELGRPVILSDLIELQERDALAASRRLQMLRRRKSTVSWRRWKGMRIRATQLPDWPGLVVMRTVAMLANEGFETVLQGGRRGSRRRYRHAPRCQLPEGPDRLGKEDRPRPRARDPRRDPSSDGRPALPAPHSLCGKRWMMFTQCSKEKLWCPEF